MVKQIIILVEGTSNSSFNYKTYLAKTKCDYLYWSTSQDIDNQNTVEVINNRLGHNIRTFEVVDINNKYSANLNTGINNIRRVIPPGFNHGKYIRNERLDIETTREDCWNHFVTTQTKTKASNANEQDLIKYAQQIKKYTVSIDPMIVEQYDSGDSIIKYQAGIATLIRNAIRIAKKKFSECWCLIVKDDIHIDDLDNHIVAWKKQINNTNLNTRVIANKQLHDNTPALNNYFWFGRIYDLDELFGNVASELDLFPTIYSMKKTNKCFKSLDMWICQSEFCNSTNIAYVHLPCGHPICIGHSQSGRPKRCYCGKVVKTKYNCGRGSAINWVADVALTYLDLNGNAANVPIPVKSKSDTQLFLPELDTDIDTDNLTLELCQPKRQLLDLGIDLKSIDSIRIYQKNELMLDSEENKELVTVDLIGTNHRYQFNIDIAVSNKCTPVTSLEGTTDLVKPESHICLKYLTGPINHRSLTGYINVSLAKSNSCIGSYMHGCWQDNQHMNQGILTSDRIINIAGKSMFFVIENYHGNIPGKISLLYSYHYPLNRVVAFVTVNKYQPGRFVIRDIDTNTSSILIDSEGGGYIDLYITENGHKYLSRRLKPGLNTRAQFININKTFKCATLVVEFIDAKVFSVKY